MIKYNPVPLPRIKYVWYPEEIVENEKSYNQMVMNG
jgi:hypothetical protein